MDPNFDKMTGFNLPQPVEVAPTIPAPEAAKTVAVPEKDSVRLASAQPLNSAPVASTIPMSTASADPTPFQSMASSSTTANTPVVADDNDLIEKEWVSKAKEIVEKTKEDPYTQSQELTKFKADYMRKRYNKELKLSE